MWEVGSMWEVGWHLSPRSYLIIRRLLFPRSKAFNGGLGRVGGEGHGRRFALGFLQPGAAERDPGPSGQCYCQRGREVGGSKVYSVHEQAASASSGGGGLGRGRRLCEQRKRRGSKGCWR